MRLRRTYTAIYQELVDRYGFAGSYNSIKGFSGRIVRREPEQFDHGGRPSGRRRIHGSAKRQVEAMFQEERTHLQPLPPQGFQYFTECERMVGDDTRIRIDHSSYAARPAAIGNRIRDRHTLALLRTHPRALTG